MGRIPIGVLCIFGIKYIRGGTILVSFSLYQIHTLLLYFEQNWANPRIISYFGSLSTLRYISVLRKCSSILFSYHDLFMMVRPAFLSANLTMMSLAFRKSISFFCGFTF